MHGKEQHLIYKRENLCQFVCVYVGQRLLTDALDHDKIGIVGKINLLDEKYVKIGQKD